MDSAVTKLLVATKQLLEGLTKWSQGKISEEEVSDIYVRLGNCFNAAVAAFTKEGISMKCVRNLTLLPCGQTDRQRFQGISKKYLRSCEHGWRPPSTKRLQPLRWRNTSLRFDLSS